MVSESPVSNGQGFMVIVTAPDATEDDESLFLRWGDTSDLSWEEKAGAPRMRDTSDTPATAQADAGLTYLMVFAPTQGPGRYDLRLFRGERLLDVLPVIVD